MALLKKFKYPILFSCLALGLLAAVAYSIYASPPAVLKAVAPTAAANPGAVMDYQIIYTNQGYSPSSLQVPLGARVSFVNNSDIPMWTASDPHPTHTDYPAFDAKADFLKGQSYTFVFTKTGTFGYHNHERSIDRGIIRVTDPANPLPNIDKTKEGQRAVRDKFLAMFVPGDTSSIYKVMDAINADPVLANDCHDMAHDLGHRAYELYGFSGAMTFNDPSRLSNTDTDDICAGGYMHGILEELFLHQPELAKNPEPICSGVPALNRGSCFHGVGHGLMFVNKRNVPASLAVCQSLSLTADAHRCYEGVWMEMFWGLTDHAGADSLGWTLQKPLAPCVAASLDQKPACFLYAHLGYLRSHHKDFTGAINLCSQSGLGQTDENFCLKGVGITMMKHFTSRHLELSESLVANFAEPQKYAYYQGVIGYARLSAVSDADLTQNFCNILKTDTSICLAVMANDPR